MLEGKDKLIANFQAIIKQQPRVMAAALYQEGQSIMTEAKNETPVDFGALIGTGDVEQPVISGESVSVELGFGGPSAPYALYVHEDLEAKHTVGKAKFLEDPFNRHKANMEERIGKRIEANLK